MSYFVVDLGFQSRLDSDRWIYQVGHHGTGSLNFTELRGCMRQKVFSQMKTPGDDKASVFEGSIKDCLCQKCAMKDCLCELGLRQSDIRYFTWYWLGSPISVSWVKYSSFGDYHILVSAVLETVWLCTCNSSMKQTWPDIQMIPKWWNRWC